ncbi:MAG: hypothetical protein ACOC41_01185 [Chitinivibrionales bacterium]
MNYGSDERPLCFECNYVEEKEKSHDEKIQSRKETSQSKEGRFSEETKHMEDTRDQEQKDTEIDGRRFYKEAMVICTSCCYEGFAPAGLRWDGFLEFTCPSCGRIEINRLKNNRRLMWWTLVYFSAAAMVIWPPESIISIPGLLIILALTRIHKDNSIKKKMEDALTSKRYDASS